MITIKSNATEEEFLKAMAQSMAEAERTGVAAIQIQVEEEKKEIPTYDFGEVIKSLETHQCIAYRKSWDTDGGHFIFSQVPATIPCSVIPKMQSLPARVKQVLLDRGLPSIQYNNQIVMVHPNNDIFGWQPSVSDIKAGDWVILA